jgi:integrase/recombinase XerD
MTTPTTISTPAAVPPPGGADAEARLLAHWLHGRSPHTQAAYRTAWRDFRAFCDTPLDRLTLGELQAWADHLAGSSLAAASRTLRLTALKSLLAFAHRIGVCSR